MKQTSADFVRKTIRNLGLTNTESTVYINLANRGLIKCGEVAQNLKMSKSQVYHVLKILQNKGWVQSTLEFPTRFTAIPIEEVMDSQIKLKHEEAQSIDSAKKELLSHMRALDKNNEEQTPQKIVVIDGRNKMFVKIFQMIEEAKDEIKVILSGYPLSEITSMGIYPVTFKKLKKGKIRIRVLTQPTKDNQKMIKQTLKTLKQRGLENQVELRYLADPNLRCRLQIKDKQEALLHQTPNSAPSPKENQEGSAIWTNSTAFVAVCNALFEELWADPKGAHENPKETDQNHP